MKRIILSLALMVLFFTIAYTNTACAAVVYVDQNSLSPYPDGKSWSGAFKTVQGGLNATASGDEIWVAKGTYFENITLKDGIALYGGFTGLETTRDQRNFKVNETILDGHRAGTVINAGQYTQIDGFTIQNGSGTPWSAYYADAGGILVRYGNATIANNKIINNSVTSNGGGIYVYSGNTKIINNIISGNSAWDGGGILLFGSAYISGNTIQNNHADYGYGGGIYVGSASTITNNTIQDNSAWQGYGGGIAVDRTSATITNNVISRNTAGWAAGGFGGGIFAAGYNNENEKTIVSNNIVTGNSAVSGGGLFGTYKTVSSNVIAGNKAYHVGGAIYTQSSYVNTQSIINNTISDNSLFGTCCCQGGGIYIGGGGSIPPIVVNNIIAFSTSGIYSEISTVTLRKNDVYGNTDYNYAGLQPGVGDISADPMFANRSVGDYHLQAGSPCIDAGDDSVVQPGWTDIDGDPRIIGAHVDIGADEFSDITPPTAWATPAGGTYNKPQQVSLSASEPASIYYTTDGSTPTTSSMQYIGMPINILTTTILKFMAIDTAGNQSQVYTENYIIDTDPPQVSLCLCGTLGDNGWFTSDVRFGISATDTISGVASKEYSLNGDGWNVFSTPVTISNEGTTTICYRATDNAGNTSATKSHDVKIDKTAPTTMVSLEGTLGNNGWYISNVIVTLTAADTVSGVARTEYSFDNTNWTTYTAPFVISTEGTTTVYYRSIDNAGNVETCQAKTINDDKTAPQVDATAVGGTLGGGGYYTTPPQIKIIPGSDGNGSGYDHTEYSWDCSSWFTYSDPILVTEDGTKICYYRSVDKAGNIGPVKSIIVKIDKTKPTTSISLNGTSGQNGWYTSDVVVTLTAEDTTSGVAKTEYSFDNTNWTTYTAPFTMSTEGVHNIYYRSIDVAGNIESTNQHVIKIDKTQPQITITTPADGTEYLLNQLVLANWSVLDPISGIFSAVGTVPSGNPIDTASVGTKSFSVSAQDYAGNASSKAVTYYVRYSYIGILQPIKQDGSSIFKLGSTVPVKFQLQDANGSYVSTAVNRLDLAKVSDSITGTELEAISTSAATTGNLFRYDSTSNQYIFNLATDSLSTGTWQLRIGLDDGSSKYVNISLK